MKAYISWDVYERNQRLIANNDTRYGGSESTGPVRKGEALLSGLLRCGHCGLQVDRTVPREAWKQFPPLRLLAQHQTAGGGISASPSEPSGWIKPSALLWPAHCNRLGSRLPFRPSKKAVRRERKPSTRRRWHWNAPVTKLRGPNASMTRWIRRIDKSQASWSGVGMTGSQKSFAWRPHWRYSVRKQRKPRCRPKSGGPAFRSAAIWSTPGAILRPERKSANASCGPPWWRFWSRLRTTGSACFLMKIVS